MVLSGDAYVCTHAVFDRLRWTLAELGRTWQKLIKSAEFGRIRSSWQNLAELFCRVFHRDIPTVTGLVLLQYYHHSYSLYNTVQKPSLTKTKEV